MSTIIRARSGCLSALLAVSSVAFAQDVAIFKTKAIGPYDQAIEAFQAVCQHKATVFDMHGDDLQGLALVEQIRAAEPKVVLAVGTRAARLAKEKLPRIPVIFCMVLNPDRNGVLGSNTTGVLLRIPYWHQFTMIKTRFPKVKLVGVLYDPTKTEDRVDLAIEEAAQVGITLVPAIVHSEAEVAEALDGLLCHEIDFLWLTTDSTVLNQRTFAYIVTVTLSRNLPVMAPQPSFVNAGAFVAIQPSYEGIGKQAGKMANRILSGTKVSDIPVEPPSDNTLVLNLKACGQLGWRCQDVDGRMLDEHGLPYPLFIGVPFVIQF